MYLFLPEQGWDKGRHPFYNIQTKTKALEYADGEYGKAHLITLTQRLNMKDLFCSESNSQALD